MEEPTPDFQITLLPVTEDTLEDKLSALLSDLKDKGFFERALVNTYLPTDRKLRHQALSSLKQKGLDIWCTLFTCTHQGQHENLHFLWKIPEEDVDIQQQTAVIEKVKQHIPRYHSMYVKQSFVRSAAKLNIKPAYARFLYKLATQDASASANSATEAVDNRLIDFVNSGDPEIVVDLRSLRTNPSTYDEFFGAAAKVIEGHIGTAWMTVVMDPLFM